uniref:Uncharacterized protein n=1 Tax=Siphoviridae sp. ctJe739 TaxID=2826241 RepID=A0A8S5N973_9CAUD|nr:MAG TPA: hypothetical protein [Siphoviridae sp. ctJe739]
MFRPVGNTLGRHLTQNVYEVIYNLNIWTIKD